MYSVELELGGLGKEFQVRHESWHWGICGAAQTAALLFRAEGGFAKMQDSMVCRELHREVGYASVYSPIGHSVMGRRETQGGSILHAGQMEALLDGNVGFFIVKFIN